MGRRREWGTQWGKEKEENEGKSGEEGRGRDGEGRGRRE